MLDKAICTPHLVSSDWSSRWGFEDYLAEATVFLPGYDFTASDLRILANGQSTGPVDRRVDGGGVRAVLRQYVPKSDGVDKVVFDVSYRPEKRFVKAFTLHFTVQD